LQIPSKLDGNLSFRRSYSLKLHEKYTPYYERR
jgi:hypothetical protein